MKNSPFPGFQKHDLTYLQFDWENPEHAGVASIIYWTDAQIRSLRLLDRIGPDGWIVLKYRRTLSLVGLLGARPMPRLRSCKIFPQLL